MNIDELKQKIQSKIDWYTIELGKMNSLTNQMYLIYKTRKEVYEKVLEWISR